MQHALQTAQQAEDEGRRRRAGNRRPSARPRAPAARPGCDAHAAGCRRCPTSTAPCPSLAACSGPTCWTRSACTWTPNATLCATRPATSTPCPRLRGARWPAGRHLGAAPARPSSTSPAPRRRSACASGMTSKREGRSRRRCRLPRTRPAAACCARIPVIGGLTCRWCGRARRRPAACELERPVKSTRTRPMDTAVIHAIGSLVAGAAAAVVGLPPLASWPFIAASVVITRLLHRADRRIQARRTSSPYPLMRGTAPLLVALSAGLTW